MADKRSIGELMTLVGIAAIVLSPAVGVAYAADPLAAYDEFIISAKIMDECHLAIAGEMSEQKVRKIGEDAWHEIWASLDKETPSDHDKNGRMADLMLKKRTEAAFSHGHELARSEGCVAPIDNARALLESVRK